MQGAGVAAWREPVPGVRDTLTPANEESATRAGQDNCLQARKPTSHLVPALPRVSQSPALTTNRSHATHMYMKHTYF